MTTLQSELHRACAELGLRIVTPFTLTLNEGGKITAQAPLPQLGGPKGMIVVSRSDDLCEKESELVSMGYGHSVLEDPLPDSPQDQYDVDSYAEMFAEWGWGSSDEKRPEWMD